MAKCVSEIIILTSHYFMSIVTESSRKTQNDFSEKEDAFLVLYQLLSENQLPSDMNIDFDIRLINIPVAVLCHHSLSKGTFWRQNFYQNFIERNPEFEPSAHLIPVCQKLLHKL